MSHKDIFKYPLHAHVIYDQEVLTFTMNKGDIIMYNTGISVVHNLGTVEKLLGS